jgi:hypothetical protein
VFLEIAVDLLGGCELPVSQCGTAGGSTSGEQAGDEKQNEDGELLDGF